MAALPQVVPRAHPRKIDKNVNFKFMVYGYFKRVKI
jgi:hypothetical protein